MNQCVFKLKNGQQCSRSAKCATFCLQHFKLSKYDLPSCPVCLDPVKYEDDALFSCSFYTTGKNACAIHMDCARGLRKTECPCCRGVLHNTKRMNIDGIKANEKSDHDARKAEESREPTMAELIQILGADNDPNVMMVLLAQSSQRHVEQLEQIAFQSIIQSLEAGEDPDQIHHHMHQINPTLSCETIENMIDSAMEMFDIAYDDEYGGGGDSYSDEYE
jgi:hypothetical protein